MTEQIKLGITCWSHKYF